MPRQTTNETVAKARRLRREMTLPEVLLWRLLKQQPQGVKFRRQHPAGPFVLDFYCPAIKTGFEIDGIVHTMGDRPQSDTDRDAWLNEQGIAVVRISAAEMLKSVDSVASSIVAFCLKGRG